MVSGNLRVFVAIDIGDAEILSRLENARDLILSTKADVKPVSRENMHITLRFIGEVPLELANEICKALETIRFKPFKIRIKGVGVFPNISRPRVIWAGVDGDVEKLVSLHDEVEARLRKLGLPGEKEKFIPHVTLARVKSGRNREALVKTIMSISDMVFGEITVDRILLKRSILTPSGPIYSDICSVRAAD
jgi:2'-5' RNA ligase